MVIARPTQSSRIKPYYLLVQILRILLTRVMWNFKITSKSPRTATTTKAGSSSQLSLMLAGITLAEFMTVVDFTIVQVVLCHQLEENSCICQWIAMDGYRRGAFSCLVVAKSCSLAATNYRSKLYFLISFRSQAFTRWTPGRVNCLAIIIGQRN